MAEKKKKGKFHSIHIRPMAGTHYSVHHEPVHEPAENAAMPTIGGAEEKNEKLFAHGERAGLHQHLDELLDAHEGKAAHQERMRSRTPTTCQFPPIIFPAITFPPIIPFTN